MNANTGGHFNLQAWFYNATAIFVCSTVKKMERIKVFLRVRPQDQEGTGPDDTVTYTSDRKVLVKKTPKEFSYEFDWVFKPDSTQAAVYRSVVEPMIRDVTAGYKCTVLAYGYTGTGRHIQWEWNEMMRVCHCTLFVTQELFREQ
jgi:hypothetical protein